MTCEPACAVREECADGACLCVEGFTNISGSCHLDFCFSSSSVPVCGANFTCIAGIGYHSCLCAGTLVAVNDISTCQLDTNSASSSKSITSIQAYAITACFAFVLLLLVSLGARCLYLRRTKKRSTKDSDVAWKNDNLDYFWDNAVASMSTEQRGEIFSTPPDNISTSSFTMGARNGSDGNNANIVSSVSPADSSYRQLTTRLNSGRPSALAHGITSTRTKRYSMASEGARRSDNGTNVPQPGLGFRKVSMGNYDIGDGLEPVYVEPRIKSVYRPAEDSEGYYVIERDKRNVRNSWLSPTGDEFRHSLISTVSDVGSEHAEILPVQPVVRKRYTVRGTNVDACEVIEEHASRRGSSQEPTYQLALRDSSLNATPHMDSPPPTGRRTSSQNGFTSPLYEFAVSAPSIPHGGDGVELDGFHRHSSATVEAGMPHGVEESAQEHHRPSGSTSGDATIVDTRDFARPVFDDVRNGSNSNPLLKQDWDVAVSHSPELAHPCTLSDAHETRDENHEQVPTNAGGNVSAVQKRRESII